MIDISIEGKKYLLPESWDDITARDLSIISDLYTRFYTTQDFLKFALIRLLGIRRYLVRYRDQLAFARGIYRMVPFPFVVRHGISKGKVKVFPQEDLLVLSQTLTWINTPTSKVTLTRNLLQGITIRRKPFFRIHASGPADFLVDVTAFEYSKAETAFLEYCSSLDPAKLNELVGALYRPKKWFWRIEKLFSGKDCPPRLEYTGTTFGRKSYSSFSAGLKDRYSVLLYFQGCRNRLIDLYPFVFSTGDSSGEHSSGWAGVFRALTNENIAGIDKILELPIHTVLFDLNEKIRINKQRQNQHSNG